jgi:erythromycin esterase-like protein
VFVAACGHAVPVAPATVSSPLDPIVRDVCSKRVVLLGEDSHHAGGATLEVKAALVEQLVDECGFSAVLFESNVAEFVDLDRSLAAGTATPAHVADAIGALWSTTRESDALVDALFARAARRTIVLGGLDGQIGSTDLYAQTGLADELAGYLDDPSRAACRTELDRYANWRYDDTSPFDDAAHERLGGCLTEIESAIARRPRSARAGEAAAMTGATRAAIAADGLSDAAAFDARDRAMYDAYRWHAARLPPDAKIIVWCATLHAAKSLRPLTQGERVPLGAYLHGELGDAVAAIGFSAMGGSYGRVGKPAIAIAAAPADSLESRAFVNAGPDVRYLERVELARAPAPARALDYDRFASAPWSEIVDGLVVLRTERPPDYAHDRTPRRAPAK